MEYQAVTCTLTSGAGVIFDVPDTTADDVVESFTLADYYNAIIG